MVRSEVGLEAAVDRLLSIYARAIDEPPGEGDALVATAAHLQRIALPFKESHSMSARVQTLSGELELARTERDALDARLRAIEAAIADRELIRAERERVLERQLHAFRSLPTLRVRDALLRIPVVGPVVRTTARRLAKLLD